MTAFSSAELAAWAVQHVSPRSVVVSDGLSCFRAVTAAGCDHQPQIVGKNRKSTGMGCFNWINTILGNLKTTIAGTCHAFAFEKYAGRYLAEVQYRAIGASICGPCSPGYCMPVSAPASDQKYGCA